MSGEQQAPAGWYDDGRGAKRYWDGQRWTEWIHDPAAGGDGVRSQPLQPAPTTASASEAEGASEAAGATASTTAVGTAGATASAEAGGTAGGTEAAATPSGTYRCPYCRRTGALGPRGECRSCGAHARLQEIVSDSGWEELPGAEDLAHIQIGRSSVQVAGDSVPIAEFTLVDGDAIWFPHHKLTYAEEQVQLAKHADGNGFLNRVRAGTVTTTLLSARGPGRIALSDDHMGEIVALPVDDGHGYWVRDHVFLAATPTIAYRPHENGLWLKFRKDSGRDTEYEVEYPLGRYDELFQAQGGPGLLLLHSPGNTMFRDLGAGETIRIPPQALLYRDLSVTPYLVAEYPSTTGWRAWFGTQNYENRHLWLSLAGPGRVAISSKYEKEHAHPYPIVDGTVQFHRW
ncbi:AIM24 family protein [uncultured Amnibacterium sp.]|uniref:AIM24 family protein n=1 Tax=uncultured Amnibacterium sp. TaxID=1631851 RepID=UPI0035CB4CA7